MIGGSVRRGAAAALLAVLAGCVTTPIESSGRPLAPEPRAVSPTPGDADVDVVVLQVGPKPKDTDNNGFPDLIEVEVHLFSRRHPMPFWRDGTFRFELYAAGGSASRDRAPMRVWTREGAALADARVVTGVAGPAYRFDLGLLDVPPHRDELAPGWADLLCRFTPAGGGEAVRSTGVRHIQLGSPLGSAKR